MKQYLLFFFLIFSTNSTIQAQSDFVFVYRVAENSLSVEPPKPATEIEYTVDWGDGTPVTTYTPSESPSHTYATPGDKTITYTGQFTQLSFRGTYGQGSPIIAVEEWGDHAWTSMEGMFQSCTLLERFTNDELPNLSQCTSMKQIFQEATSFNQDIGGWDMSSVLNMQGMFSGASSFDQPINDWDVSSVIDMSWMFAGANLFSQDLNSWDVSSVINMELMFSGTQSFNEPLNDWDVSSVTNMSYMFLGAQQFNKDISSWDVSSVINMQGMFSLAQSFNQSLNAWDVSNVENMREMFIWNSIFDADIGNWQTSSVKDMSYMFNYATAFNQDIGDWDVSSVTNMFAMFHYATSFNKDIGGWDVSSVVNFDLFLDNSIAFGQNLSEWDVSSAETMLNMFRGTQCDYDLSNWNTYRVINMAGMFSLSPFDHSLGSWDISKVVNMTDMLDVALEDGSQGISQENYDDTLIGWASQDLQLSVPFGAGSSQYCSAEESRDLLINTFNWTISDGGKEDNCESLSTDENLLYSAIVFPNPTADIVYVSLRETGLATSYQLFNIQGQMVLEGGLQSSISSLDLRGFDSGLYFLKLGEGNTIKIVKE